MTEELTAVPEKAAKFSKEQILGAARYAKRRDLLYALLEDDKTYSFEEVDARIKKFMEGKVN